MSKLARCTEIDYSLASERLEELASMVVSAVVVIVENVAVPKTGEQGPSAVL